MALPRIATISFVIRRLLIVIVLLGAAGLAQEPAAASKPAPLPEARDQQQFSQEFGFWGGYAANSPLNIGVSPDRKFLSLNGRYSIVVLTSRHTSLRWVSEVVPVAILWQPTGQYYDSRLNATLTQPANTKYAFGLTPLGLQFNVMRHRKVQPFAGIDGGFLVFNGAVPVPDARAFNFTFSFGGGVEIFTSDHNSLTLGFKYHHLSNNETAPANPGVDSPMVYAGYSWWKRHR